MAQRPDEPMHETLAVDDGFGALQYCCNHTCLPWVHGAGCRVQGAMGGLDWVDWITCLPIHAPIWMMGPSGPMKNPPARPIDVATNLAPMTRLPVKPRSLHPFR